MPHYARLASGAIVGGGAVTNSAGDYRARKARNIGARLPHTWFSTTELNPELRHEGWRRTVGVCLDSSLSCHEAPAEFSATIEGYLLEDIVFSRPQASCQKFDRTSLRIARDGIDHYMIELFFAGHTEMKVHGRIVRNTPGQIVCFDLGDTLDSFNSEFDVICIFVPRARLSPLLVRPDSLHGAMPDVDSGPGLLLSSYLRTLYQALPTLSPSDAPAAANALLQLTAAAFNSAAGAPDIGAGARHYGLLMRAQLYIRENLASRTLSAAEIARDLGISRTALYELFEPMGGVAAHIREMRLRKCLSEIVSPRHATTQIAEIAYRWGFDDPSVFSRAFRHRFDCAPSDLRVLAYARARTDHAGISSPIGDFFLGDRTYEDWIVGLKIGAPT
jgi:AraC-like DNA-binding protein